MQMEIGKSSATVVSRLRKPFPQLQNGAHEPPAPFVVEIAKVPQEAAKGQPSIWLDHLYFSPAAKQVNFRSTSLKRHRCIVEGRRARTDHGDRSAGKGGEIDVVGGPGHPIRR